MPKTKPSTELEKSKARVAKVIKKTETEIKKAIKRVKNAKSVEDVKKAVAKDIQIRGKKAKKTKVVSKEVYKTNVYNTLLDKVEKDLGDYSESLTNFKISSGNRCLDLIFGGGMRPYGVITFAGKETGGKTTMLMQVMRQMLKYEVPLINFDDSEGALDPKFAASILRVGKIEDVLGLKHENKWIVPPRVRYYTQTLMDRVFDRWEKLLNRIPDKIYQPELDQWFLVINKNDKKLEPMQKLLGEPNVKLSDKERLWYSVDNPYPQAAIFIDSWNDLNPSRDDDKEGSENAMALWPRGYAKNSPRVMGNIASKKVLLIGTGHIKQNPGARFQNPDYESGGNKSKHDTMVRYWFTPRAIPPEWQLPGQKSSAREEPSVEGKGTDVYQYKHILNKKNKWAQPGLETWMRIWVSNYKGLGRGVDPVFDIYYFLEQIGYLTIAQKKTITFGKADWPLTDKKLDWTDFKVLILYEDGNKNLAEQAKTVYSKLKLDKPFKFMPFCDKLNQSGVASTELRNAKLSKAEKKKADLSDDLEDDE